jgi:hypothetical protein
MRNALSCCCLLLLLLSCYRIDGENRLDFHKNDTDLKIVPKDLAGSAA